MPTTLAERAQARAAACSPAVVTSSASAASIPVEPGGRTPIGPGMKAPATADRPEPTGSVGVIRVTATRTVAASAAGAASTVKRSLSS